MVFSNRRVKGLTLLVLLFAAVTPVIMNAQVPVKKSDQKVVVRGKTYFIHTVEKGQTAFSISRAYAITVEQLHTENPDAIYGIKEGQLLKIPVNEAVTVSKPVRDDEKYVYHTVAAGETIFSLSRKYDVAQGAILQANPGVDPADIPVGAELAIPRKEFKAPVVSISPQKEQFTSYTVKEGETLASIARKFGISARDLRRANGNTFFLRAGDRIRLPGIHDVGETVTGQAAVADTISEIKAVQADTLVEIETPAGFTDISELSGSIDIGVMLPLFLPENSVRTEIDSVNPLKPRIKEKPFTWIYPLTMTFLEMYEGILIAADELRAAGMDIRIHTFDTRADSSVVSGIINSGRLRNMDMIIGPVFSYNLEMVVAYAHRLDIPVVSPVPLRNNDILTGHSRLFIVNPSQSVIEDAMAGSIGTHFDQNLVYIYSDTAAEGNKSEPFRNRIMKELSFHAEPGSVNFKQFQYRSWSSSRTDSLNRLAHTLSPSVNNIVILGTEDEAAISETLMNLFTLHKKHQMIVYGYPSIRNLEYNIDLTYLFDLNINLFSPFYVDYERDMVMAFLERFRNTYRQEPSEESFAWIGYDIMRYFGSGIALHGRRFLSNPSVHNPELLHARFDFRRDSEDEGFENRGLIHLRYSNEMRIEVVNEQRLQVMTDTSAIR